MLFFWPKAYRIEKCTLEENFSKLQTQLRICPCFLKSDCLSLKLILSLSFAQANQSTLQWARRLNFGRTEFAGKFA